MAPEDIEALVIGHDDTSARGSEIVFCRKSHFLSKADVDQVITRYAITISRQHKSGEI